MHIKALAEFFLFQDSYRFKNHLLCGSVKSDKSGPFYFRVLVNNKFDHTRCNILF